MNRAKVIYIMGCGRSGTTILDIVLGNHSGFLSLGELNNSMDAWNKKRICSCGVPVRQCRIWKNVGNIFFRNDSGGEHYRIANYQNDIERQISIIKHILGLYDSSMIHEYHSYIYNIFRLLKESSSAKAIIDSSKSVGRALALLKNAKIDVQIIHLVRDPRGVYFSFQKKNLITPTKNIWSLAAYWNSVNFLASLVRLRFGDKKVLRVRYEDLISNTDLTIDKIADFINEDLSDVKIKLRDEVPMERGHLASGNRIRKQKILLKLQPDFEWMKRLKLHQRIIITTNCSPLMIAYRYI